MVSGTRLKMVAGAAELISQHGVNATSMREVVRHTGTPRGSIAHHFPQGKQQLIEDAIVFAGERVSGPLQELTTERGAVAGLRAFADSWRQTLQRTKYKAGCPVLAVAVEAHVNDGMEPDQLSDDEAAFRLLDLAHGVFTDWQRIMSNALKKDGVPAAQARRLAALVVASIEGTVVMCRASRSAKPLDDVVTELEAVLQGAIDIARPK